METLYERCCGIDVHKQRVSACLTPGPGGPAEGIRSFGTTTSEVLDLRDWLLAAECTHVAMESTGVYWKPVYNLLEGAFVLILATAQHVKALPGRKTDVGDAEWIADLVQHGLIHGSFIPPKPIRELRELTRYRKSLIQHDRRKPLGSTRCLRGRTSSSPRLPPLSWGSRPRDPRRVDRRDHRSANPRRSGPWPDAEEDPSCWSKPSRSHGRPSAFRGRPATCRTSMTWMTQLSAVVVRSRRGCIPLASR